MGEFKGLTKRELKDYIATLSDAVSRTDAEIMRIRGLLREEMAKKAQMMSRSGLIERQGRASVADGGPLQKELRDLRKGLNEATSKLTRMESTHRARAEQVKELRTENAALIAAVEQMDERRMKLLHQRTHLTGENRRLTTENAACQEVAASAIGWEIDRPKLEREVMEMSKLADALQGVDTDLRWAGRRLYSIVRQRTCSQITADAALKVWLKVDPL